MDSLLGSALAYIDPGTGGFLIGSLWGLVASVAAAMGAFFFRPWRRFSPRWSWLWIGALGLLVMLLLFRFAERTTPMTQKLLLIGLDGFDPKLVERMMGEGKLPHFARLKQHGDYRRLQTVIPPETPVAIGTVLTGTNPGRFGIFDFISRDPLTYLPKIHLYEESQSLGGTRYVSALKAPPLWQRLRTARVPATFIRWPLTFPPGKTDGRMLSGLGAVDIKGFMNSYHLYTTNPALRQGEGAEKVTVVERTGPTLHTQISGPRVKRRGEVVEVAVPMTIRLLPDHLTLTVNGATHAVKPGAWSEWIRVTFPVGMFRRVSAICKVHLISLDPELRLYMTSLQIDPEDPVIPISYPRRYAKQLARAVGLFHTLGMPEDTKAVTEGRLEKTVFLEQLQQIERERTAMFWHEFNRFHAGVLAFYFDASDRLQHLFWDEGPGAEVEEYYRNWDALLGEILDRLDERTALIIFSDHGFTSFEKAVSLNTWLAQHGYLSLTKPVTEDDAGELFRSVDWQRTKAYSVGFASLYVNRKGRERRGIVEPQQVDGLLDELTSRLAKLTDPQTGQPVITRVYRATEIYDGPYVKDGPDLLVGFADGYRMSWRNAVGGLSVQVVEPNTKAWRGDHLVDPSHVPAILFTNFPVNRPHVHLRDIAPTVFAVLGRPAPEGFEGNSFFGE